MMKKTEKQLHENGGKTFTEINVSFRMQFLPLQGMSEMEPKHEQDVDQDMPKTQKSGKPHQQERKQTKVNTEPKNSQSCENFWRNYQVAKTILHLL